MAARSLEGVIYSISFSGSARKKGHSTVIESKFRTDSFSLKN